MRGLLAQQAAAADEPGLGADEKQMIAGRIKPVLVLLPRDCLRIGRGVAFLIENMIAQPVGQFALVIIDRKPGDKQAPAGKLGACGRGNHEIHGHGLPYPTGT